MIEISGRYLGDLRVEVAHGPTGATIRTVAPVDNNGDGSTFSPSDLCASSLGACMTTIMGIVAARDQIDLTSLRFRVEKHMSQEGPRRIARLPVEFHMPAGLSPDQRVKLERAALTCPVHRSLSSDIDIPVHFVYPD
ncbi:MAG: OsmC family protein [Myxococcales bacterium]|nr:OsmC family protein [Myxococcales bacterium]